MYPYTHSQLAYSVLRLGGMGSLLVTVLSIHPLSISLLGTEVGWGGKYDRNSNYTLSLSSPLVEMESFCQEYGSFLEMSL